MNEKNLRVLEFPKIRERMAALAITEMGRERALSIVPSSDARPRRQAPCSPTMVPIPWRHSPMCANS